MYMPYKDGVDCLVHDTRLWKVFKANHKSVYSSYGPTEVKDIQVKDNAGENIVTHPYRFDVLGDDSYVVANHSADGTVVNLDEGYKVNWMHDGSKSQLESNMNPEVCALTIFF